MKADTGARDSPRGRRHQRSAQTKAASREVSTGSASKITSSEGPSHVLFSALGALRSTNSNNIADSNQRESKRKRLPVMDPRLETDYVYKRRRAHEVSSLFKENAVSVTGPWDGVSALEQELIKCCEALPDDFYNDESDQDNNSNSNTEEDENYDTDGVNSSSVSPLVSLSPANPIGGVLAIEKECRFAAILSRGCHTMASRSLAIAILERTLEAYLEEKATSAFLLRQQQQKDKDDEPSVGENNNIGRSTQERPERAKTPAEREGNPFPNNATTRNENESVVLSSADNTFLLATEGTQRFRLFFAAGGLRILNQWLADASSYETTTSSSSLPAGTPKSGFAIRGKNSNNANVATKALSRKAHTTRPIALSILLFLEHIPFEKKIVTNSKINKQVQKLGKKVLSIQEAHQKKEAPMEDLEHWSNQKSHDQALTRTLEAIDAVKASWREKAKAIKGERKKQQLQLEQQQANPFGLLQSRIRERWNIWNEFKSGALSTRPKWYRPVPASAKNGLTPRYKKANNEAETEKRILEKKIKQVQSKNQRSLKQLREKLRKHKHHTHSAGNQVSSSFKRVSWRDGLKSQVARNRQVLEDVAVFGKDLPPSSVDLDYTHPDHTQV